ncbi:hypothetical protein GCM10027598_74800 [Amycolatopsis oliviviridis]|uniref:Uncharacterized protein n=1 Tax=Amycolatopsis oliviviridis TaxID=1471590 RepID=A0ABQ3L9E6_9PSEU|nr:hypothetical protein GCM10017790_04740 [Amycolatopsis oliviviridis]
MSGCPDTESDRAGDKAPDVRDSGFALCGNRIDEKLRLSGHDARNSHRRTAGFCAGTFTRGETMRSFNEFGSVVAARCDGSDTHSPTGATPKRASRTQRLTVRRA